MNNRKKPIPAKDATIVSNSTPNNNPFVFISHDTRDAELAEEFGKLLKSASTGALKSFCSSDRKGNTGIPYGEEWYPTIMDKLDEASDVVCLLTKHSVDRPWILYEAGVAKGKLDKKVIGIALGISLQSAVTGPFAQFQNNNGDVDSVTNLILSLIKTVPGLDPEQDVVKFQVEKFIVRVNEITATLEEKIVDKESNEANSVTKLFEEVKVMFDALPSRIENRVNPENKRRGRRKFHPMMFEEILHLGGEYNDPLIGFLMMISLFKEDYPWVYEVGLDTYRGLKSSKSSEQKRKLINHMEAALEMTSHPIMREFQDKNEDFYYIFKEMRHFVRHYLERYVMISNDDQHEGHGK
jgi:hypothetical protein